MPINMKSRLYAEPYSQVADYDTKRVKYVTKFSLIYSLAKVYRSSVSR